MSIRRYYDRSFLGRLLEGRCEGTCGGERCRLSRFHFAYCEGTDHGWSYRADGLTPECSEHADVTTDSNGYALVKLSDPVIWCEDCEDLLPNPDHDPKTHSPDEPLYRVIESATP